MTNNFLYNLKKYFIRLFGCFGKNDTSQFTINPDSDDLDTMYLFDTYDT
jgi:hypothetical protein